jgi:hypothetical protein
MMVIDGDVIWTADDEVYLQDHIEQRQRDEEKEVAARLFRRMRENRFGEEVSLLVDHPFKGRTWVITGIPDDAPGFYRCTCVNGFESVFHDSDLTNSDNR